MNKKWELCVIFSPRFEYHIILSTKDKYSRRYPQAYVKETLSRWVWFNADEVLKKISQQVRSVNPIEYGQTTPPNIRRRNQPPVGQLGSLFLWWLREAPQPFILQHFVATRHFNLSKIDIHPHASAIDHTRHGGITNKADEVAHVDRPHYFRQGGFGLWLVLPYYAENKLFGRIWHSISGKES